MSADSNSTLLYPDLPLLFLLLSTAMILGNLVHITPVHTSVAILVAHNCFVHSWVSCQPLARNMLLELAFTSYMPAAGMNMSENARLATRTDNEKAGKGMWDATCKDMPVFESQSQQHKD